MNEKKKKEPKPLTLKQRIFNELSLSARVEELVQKCPYTYVKVHAWYQDKKYTAVGFAKVHWPDKWSERDGSAMARDHALGSIAKDIKNGGLQEHEKTEVASQPVATVN